MHFYETFRCSGQDASRHDDHMSRNLVHRKESQRKRAYTRERETEACA